MTRVDHTKTKQLLIDFSRQSIRTDNIILAMEHAQKQVYWRSIRTQYNLDLKSPVIWVLIGN